MEEFVFWKELIVMLVTLSCFDSGLKNDSTRGVLGLLVCFFGWGGGGGAGREGEDAIFVVFLLLATILWALKYLLVVSELPSSCSVSYCFLYVRDVLTLASCSTVWAKNPENTLSVINNILQLCIYVKSLLEFKVNSQSELLHQLLGFK